MHLPRILFAHEFDPAGVHIGWREMIRAAGGEAYVAARLSFLHRADFDTGCPDPEAIFVCPGVGDGGGAAIETTGPLIALPQWVEDILAQYPQAKRIALFHGSIHTWANLAGYAALFVARGFHLAATTLDYVDRIASIDPRVTYLPPLAQRTGISKDHDSKNPLIVLQTPSDPVLCATQTFLNAARQAGAIPLVSNRQPHGRNLWLKTRFPVGFDHLRGSFSLNALENAACGQASIFGMTAACRDRAKIECIDPLPSTAIAGTHEALEAKIGEMVETPDMVALAQEESFTWWEDNFDSPHIIARFDAMFEEIA